MATILNSALTSVDTVNAIADDVALTAKESLYGLKNVAKKDWMEIFYYFQLYNVLYLDNAHATGYLTAQEELDIKEEIYQAFLP